MARLEQAITNLIDIFTEYAGDDGKLSKEEFMNLLEKEIENPEMKEKISEAQLTKVLRKKDKKKDGLNFREYCMCMSFVLKRYHVKKGGKNVDDEEDDAAE